MDEFTSIAMWIMIAFLMVNATIVWFGNSQTFQDYGIGIGGVKESDSFTENSIDTLQNVTLFGIVSCNNVSPTDLAYGPCFLVQALEFFKYVSGQLWSFLTAWVGILDLILDNVPAGELFKNILIPLLGAIEVMAIFVIVMRIAGIIRGGS